MEQHAIPRQITNFEFKLVGFMTLRQFLYLVAFIPMGFIVYKVFPIPIIKFLLGLLVAGFGAALAFLPINERPMDVYIKNFYKRLTSPTQYMYGKHNEPLYFLHNLYFVTDPHRVMAHIESQEKLAEYLSRTAAHKVVGGPPPQQIHNLLQQPTTQLRPPVNVAKPMGQAPIGPTPPAINPMLKPPPPTPDIQAPIQPGVPQTPIKPLVRPAQPVMAVQSAVPAPSRVAPPRPTIVQPRPIPPGQRPVTGQQPIARVMSPQPPVPVQQPIQVRPAPTVVPSQTPPTVPASMVGHVSTGIKNPFITGVIRNNKRIPLPGVLVYLKDPQNKPLRLLKTNTHGIFATYNPLPNGDYLVEVKDPKGGYFFDTMKIKIDNMNLTPFEFYSKELL